MSGGPGVTSSGSGAGGGGNCKPVLTGIVRDFKAYDGGAGHPDFETFSGQGLKGIVKATLGPDHKPVYASAGPTAHTTGPAEFNQWYRDEAGVNMPIEFTINPTITPDGLLTYTNNEFFPIDNQGFGNEGNPHNFHFTFELHMNFKYKGGEIFSFTGDDDLWVFVNDRLAIDLGGLHPAQSDTLDLDARAAELGLEIGKEYPLDFFQAERHTTASNFSIQSSLEFTNCDPIVY
jgi:fibro-slime domain-containing protein